MTELVANFTLTDNPIEANFNLAQSNIDALFEIKAAGATWGSIVGNIADQTDLQAALNAKQDIIADLEAIRTGAQNGDFSYSTILTYGDIVTYNAAAFATAAQGALAETALQSVTSTDITTALGYIPYNSSNPNGYITANALTDYALLSDIPTDNVQLSNGAGYITNAALEGYVLSSDLATVATTGDYDDLINKPVIPAAQVNSDWNAVSGAAQILNKPTIPTVNNATLTIQKNGTDVQTFTANASSNVTCNITVPTNTNELTNGAGFITGITGTDVTTALGYTPYNSSNPAGYTSNVGTVTSVNNVNPINGNVTLSIPTDTSDLTNGAGYITGINSSDVVSALGYTPYNSSNPNGYLTSSAISNMQTTNNLVTSVSSSSTDSQYPSAKLFYDTIGDIESTINTIRGV